MILWYNDFLGLLRSRVVRVVFPACRRCHKRPAMDGDQCPKCSRQGQEDGK